MYSTSCPSNSSGILRKCESDSLIMGFDDWINVNQGRFKSEDCLSTLSSEYDHCPEYISIDGDEVEIESASNVLTFDVVTYENDKLGVDEFKKLEKSQNGNHDKSPRQRRLASEAMKGMSAVLMDKLNRKFYSMRVADWLKLRTPINKKTPIYMRGKTYIFSNKGNFTNCLGKNEFMLAFSSRFWFTYRQNFQQLPCPALTSSINTVTSDDNIPNGLRTSDCGWGCMLRSGQMLLAEALSLHFLGYTWNYSSKSQRDKAFQLQIIRWFGDTPKLTSPFSIHQIVRISNHTPGEWFGPHAICASFKKALYESQEIEPKLQTLDVYFASDRIIYKDEIMEMISDRKESGENYYRARYTLKKRGMIILVPVQLGNDQYICSTYIGVIYRWLRDSHCIGIIGGKPRHSIYIIGCQDKHVICLDPHFLQDAVNVHSDLFSHETYHCMTPSLIPILELDPSCAVGFYCQGSEELSELLGRLQNISTVYLRNARGSFFPQPLIEILPGYSPICASSSTTS